MHFIDTFFFLNNLLGTTETWWPTLIWHFRHHYRFRLLDFKNSYMLVVRLDCGSDKVTHSQMDLEYPLQTEIKRWFFFLLYFFNINFYLLCNYVFHFTCTKIYPIQSLCFKKDIVYFFYIFYCTKNNNYVLISGRLLRRQLIML